MGAETAPKVLPLWPKPVLSEVEGGETEGVVGGWPAGVQVA